MWHAAKQATHPPTQIKCMAHSDKHWENEWVNTALPLAASAAFASFAALAALASFAALAAFASLAALAAA